MARTSAYAFDLTMIALSVHIGFNAMPLYQQYTPWINYQSNYLRQVESALNRIMQFDQASQDNALWNAQRNLIAFVKTNITHLAMSTS